ncbi:MAG TPA: tetratricopeptide repeat protein [Fluviicoccus sp.]|nr:tetratricopeptide repeat protein [Fluviicoccus sp.]
MITLPRIGHIFRDFYPIMPRIATCLLLSVLLPGFSAPAFSTTAAASAPTGPAFSHDGLFRLLSAEFAVSRNQPAAALKPYREEALASNDAAVLERALQIANYLQDSQAGLELSDHLTVLQPENSTAWYQKAFHGLRLQQSDTVMEALGKLIQLNPEAEIEALFLSAYPPTPEGRGKMLEAIEQLERRFPQNSQLLFAHALLAGENGQYSIAGDYIRRALAANPDNIPAILLQARILGMDNRNREALDVLSSAVMKYPNSRQVNLHYARMLIKAGHPFQAESRLKQLLERFPADGEILLMHGLLAYNNQHDPEARRSLEQLVLTGEHEDEAHFYLGMISLRGKDSDQAERHFEAIGEGPHFLPALSELSGMLASSGRVDEARRNLAVARQNMPNQAAMLYVLEAEMLNKVSRHAEAMSLLNEGVDKYPQDNLLLFSRALTADKLKNLPGFEKDMQELLSRDPENFSYLNALGYTLADQTQRFGEAEVYLRKALRLKPEDPAVIDSMGWLLYRLGNVNEALEYVQKAFKLFPDEEIGTHLAEILWVTGKRAEAAKVWQQLLQKNPTSELVLKHKAKFEQKP